MLATAQPGVLAAFTFCLLAKVTTAAPHLGDVRRVSPSMPNTTVDTCTEVGLVQVYDGSRWGYVAYSALVAEGNSWRLPHFRMLL